MTDRTPLTADRLREALAYDPETGIFTWKVKAAKNTVIGSTAGCTCPKTGYILIRLDKVLYQAHRLAWLYMTGEHPDVQIDHKDTVRNNNSWANLRLATSAENKQNQRRPGARNTSGMLGVYVDRTRGKYAAKIGVGGKSKYLGRFDTREAAYAAYLKAKREMHPFGTL